MSEETSLLLQSAILFLLILGYTAYLFNTRRKLLKQKREEKNGSSSNSPETISAIIKKLSEEKLKERAINADKIMDQSDDEMTYAIDLPSDIELVETDSCLLIKGPVESIAKICDEFSYMEQLPDGFCATLGDWRLFILEYTPQSSLEHKTVVMPADHWLFMSCKLRDSIYAEDIHPYNYVYEPFTFKRVLEYGIGAEATDYAEYNSERL
ncbi:hypothetical protein SAMN05443549_10180 [Flavobacterium fluvii]|uniref:Uncharacterized protein n=1 Tax=Flavobacterium fluvii TaxID=468056 RepID=A0A1M5DUS5_9FLAO|nr:hypothetical protein [Flavobacterium fluvii]SHF70680.1 hypothetical protein SAMN05443549_10180 [Flavobacterium fluvii]